jgi:radical SAM superfamily enzyme YgiQ (UPF0313 family)
MPSIHIINPKPNFLGYSGSSSIYDGERYWVENANLVVTTVAALVPEGWDIRLTDEQLEPVDFDAPADFVALTGQITQRDRMIELAGLFHQRGRTVIIGGPFATLDPDFVRPHADILVTGEIEEIAARLFSELAAGVWSDRYDGGFADIRLTPRPRWDLYPVDSAEMGSLQTTRGCPFDCEFCDVIQYQGRKQRHKSVDQVLAELDLLYEYGFRWILLVDDNFTVHRQFARRMLDAFAAWNAAHADDPVRFVTQASLDLARDADMLARCAAAGLRTIFVGIETINEASLRETGKRQNLLLPLREAVDNIVSAGIGIRGGVIVGFDHDGPAIFSELYAFFQSSPLPHLHVNVLAASKATRLYSRLEAEGRLLHALKENPFDTNFIPAQMSPQRLSEGTRELAHALFAAKAFEQRMMNFIQTFGPYEGALVRKTGRPNTRGRMMLKTLAKVSARGAAEKRMVSNVLTAANERTHTLPHVLTYLANYGRTRLFLDFDAEESAFRPRRQWS